MQERHAASDKEAKQQAKLDAAAAQKQAKKDAAEAKKVKGKANKALAKEKREQAAHVKRLAKGPAITWLGCLACNKWRLVSQGLLEFFADNEEFKCTDLPTRSCEDACDGCAIDADTCDCGSGSGMDEEEDAVDGAVSEREGGSEEDIDDDVIQEDIVDVSADEDEGDEGGEEDKDDQSDDDDASLGSRSED